MKLINEINNRYGKLVVIEQGFINNRTVWICKCDCGKIVKVSSKKLRNGHTKSCGCLKIKHNNATRKCGVSKTLDRIDVDGNYEPSNCRWATRIEQAQNKGYHKLIKRLENEIILLKKEIQKLKGEDL